VAGNAIAEKIATQFAIGILIKNPETPGREKIFVPPNCRLVVGRSPDNSIVIDDPGMSRHHFAFYAYDTDAFVEELAGGRSMNPILLNGEKIIGRHRLGADDVIIAGMTTFRFHKLEAR
jgi:pSer/pThr/pTyr-binding forkhead associated (FHA) protein